MNGLLRPLLAELIGTFALVFIGAGAGALGLGGVVGVAFAHGLVVVSFAYAYGHISGTHINPAVTLGVWVAGRIDTARAAEVGCNRLIAYPRFLGGKSSHCHVPASQARY